MLTFALKTHIKLPKNNKCVLNNIKKLILKGLKPKINVRDQIYSLS
jgi:hypothetical protein